MRPKLFSGFDDLTPPFRALFDGAGRDCFFLGLPWFRNFADTVCGPNDEMVIVGIESHGAALGALVLRRARRVGPLRPKLVTSLTNIYTTYYAPLLAPGLDGTSVAAVCAAFARALAALRPRINLIRIDSLAHEEVACDALRSGLRAAGFACEQFFHFGNWFEPTAGVDYAAYRNSLGGQLRSTLTRRARRMERSGGFRIDLLTGTEGLDGAIAAYERVYASSWKIPEPHPRFVPELARTAARDGALRMGVLTLNGEPAAAQIWIVSGGIATIFKLGHDERFKEFSPGSILTARLIEHVIDIDRVREIDFGHGDDPYKKDWLRQRRERWGLFAANPRTAIGAAYAARGLAKAVRDRLSASRSAAPPDR